MNIYLASRYSRRLELCAHRDELHAAGYRVTSRWLDGEHEALDGCAPDSMKAKWAGDDLRDLLAANILIAFTEEAGATRGGRHVEYGVALGLWIAGRPKHRLIVVGPRENLFYTLPQIEHHPFWRGAMRRLEADAVRSEMTEEITAVCPMCGKSFVKKRKRQRLCSKMCSYRKADFGHGEVRR